MGMAAVCSDVVVVLAAKGQGPNSDGFLADVEVQESTHASRLLIVREGYLLEAPDPHHLRVEFDLTLRGERLVDGRGCEIK